MDEPLDCSPYRDRETPHSPSTRRTFLPSNSRAMAFNLRLTFLRLQTGKIVKAPIL